MFVIEVPHLNLNQIYDSRQVPRWIKLKDDLYVVIHKDKAIKVQQQQDRFDFNRYRLMFSCNEEDFYNIWFEYFDLKIDYSHLNFKTKIANKKLRPPCNRAAGIHILKQDPWELYIYTKLVQNLGYDMAVYAINAIAQDCGIKHQQSIREHGKVVWYEFPDAVTLHDNLHKLRNLGKVNAWLDKLCKVTIDKPCYYMYNGNDLFDVLYSRNFDTFPSYEIEDVIEKNFKCTVDDFKTNYLHNVPNKGLVYMYILHYVKNPPKDLRRKVS